MTKGSRLLIAGGVVLVAAALSLDLFGIGARGFGTKQIAGVVIGVALILMAPPTRRWLHEKWSGAPRIGPQSCVTLGVSVGILVGFAEVIQMTIRYLWFGVVILQSDLFLSMVPLGHTIVFATAGVLLAVLAGVLPRVVTGPVVVFALVGPAVWSQFLLYPKLGTAAPMIVALGAGLQSARWAAGHWEKLSRILRRAVPWLVGILVLFVLGVPAQRAFVESRTMANLPPAAPGAPNVLLIVLDTVRADHLQSYGYERETSPHIDALGEEGVVLERLVSTSPWTLPAHATMFTGLYNHEHEASWARPMDDRAPTLAEILGRKGYATAGFVGNIGYCARSFGLARGFAHYLDFDFSPALLTASNPIGRRLVPHDDIKELIRHHADVITSAFLEWLPGKGDRPFFAFLNYYDAHAVYHAPEPYGSKFGVTRTDPLRFETFEPSPRFVDELINAYDGGIAYIDEHIGMIVERLRSDGMLDNTLVIVTGDHGEHFGEHGLISHGNSLYWPLLHVPFVARFPSRLPAGERVEDFVSLRDVPATILDLIGVEPDVVFPGVSLRPLWEHGTPTAPFAASTILSDVRRGIRTPEWEPICDGDMTSVIENGIQHIVNGDKSEERYDLVADPQQKNNLIGK